MGFDNGDESLNIRSIFLPNFEVSWAGVSPDRPGYWFGSEDGRVQFMSLDGAAAIGPYAIAPSGEAVNGIAFAGSLIVVSTRCDVTFLRAPEPGESHIARTVFHGGAHGVVSTHSGCIIAPMGRRGILLMDARPETTQGVRILKPADEGLYIYRIVSLASPDRGEILACAGRRGGFVTMPLAGLGLENYGKKLRPLGVDFMWTRSRSPWRHLDSIVRSTSSVTCWAIRRRPRCISVREKRGLIASSVPKVMFSCSPTRACTPSKISRYDSSAARRSMTRRLDC
jgi:hypothetical protein